MRTARDAPGEVPPAAQRNQASWLRVMTDSTMSTEGELVQGNVRSVGDLRRAARWACPPLRWWLPAAGFAGATLALTLVVVLSVPPPGPLDDPHPARQRDALLVTGPQLAPEVGGVTLGGRVVVVLFVRTLPNGPAFDSWREAASSAGGEVVVRVGAAGAALAAAVRIAVPVDGGAPVGYAVIDTGRRVRYATLDPTYAANAFEVRVLVRALS